MSDEAIEKDKYEHLNYEDRAIQGKGGKVRCGGVKLGGNVKCGGVVWCWG